MKCAYHTEYPAFNTCSRCDVWLCDSCAVTIEGRVVCKKCVANSMNMSFSANGRAEHGGDAGSRAAVHPRKVSRLWILLLSMLPGLGHMAMGFMKRGLFFMSAFFGVIYVMSLGFPFLSFVLVVLFFASLCDAQGRRRRINNGEYVRDDIDDILRLATTCKTPILIVLSVMVLHRLTNHSGAGFIVIILVCLAIWHFIKRR